MDKRGLIKFYNYLNVADGIKQQFPNIYFFLKSYAFRNILESPKSLSPNDHQKINQMYINYTDELNSQEQAPESVTKEDYNNFLESFFNRMDFNDLNMCYISRDMLEVSLTFGMLDDLSTRRMKYFVDRIASKIQNIKTFNTIKKEIPQSISGRMEKYKLPISKNDPLFKQYINDIVSLLNEVNSDIDMGTCRDIKEKMEAALVYLSSISNY